MCTKNPLYIKRFKISKGYFFGGKGVQNWHHKGYKIGTIKGTRLFTSTLKSDIIEIEIREVQETSRLIISCRLQLSCIFQNRYGRHFWTSLRRNQKRTIKRLFRYDCITCGSRLEHNDWIGE